MDQSMDRITATRPDGSELPHAIEEGIARTRVRLSATIKALERELAPKRILENSTELLRSSLEPRPGPFREQAWAYAIPLALIATGLGWLFMLRRRGFRLEMPASFGEMPGEAVEAGETPNPAPSYADLAGAVEPVSLVDEATTI